MRLSGRVQLSSRLLALLFLIGVIALAASGTRAASAAIVSQPQTIRPLVGCAPCISSLDPEQNGTVKADASGQVTLTFQAQMVNPFVQFVLTLDGTAVDSKKIQVTKDDPLQPTGTYTAALSAGAHTASVEADDADGSEAVFVGWNFTVEGSAATPVPCRILRASLARPCERPQSLSLVLPSGWRPDQQDPAMSLNQPKGSSGSADDDSSAAAVAAVTSPSSSARREAAFR